MSPTFPGAQGCLRASIAATVLILGALPLCGHAAKGADPYLQAINAEGDRLESLGKARQEEEQLRRQVTVAKPAAPKAAVAAPVTQQQFEGELRSSFPGSFALYSLMSADEKQVVFSEYQKKNAEGSARFIPAVVKIISITNAKTTSSLRGGGF